ncbi:hypothetical protein MAUB1S_08647 [Mycolicibacterium aubagnense]
MRFLKRTALTGAALAAAMHGALALDYETYDVPNRGIRVVAVGGEFLANEPLDAFMDAVFKNRATFVVFNSEGGNVMTAIRLGRLIRTAGLNTYQLRQIDCVSACALAFMGGVNRAAEPGSIGVHRSSFSPDASVSTADAVAGVQALTANIITYLNDMGVDPKLLALALSYDRSDMRYLSSSEMADLRVTTMDVALLAPTTPGTQARVQPGPAPSETDAQHREAENAALTLVKELIEQQDSNVNMAIGYVAATYAPRVDYYGKLKDLTEVIADKRGYFQRWPERGYRIRDDSVIVTCANERCMVSGTYDWIVRNTVRNKQARGAARFSYTLTIGTYPKVVAEGGEVIR